MDWFSGLGATLVLIFFVHLTVMEWSLLKSSVVVLLYHTLFLPAIALDPERVFAPELATDTRWVLVQTAVFSWVVAGLIWARLRESSRIPERR